MAETSVKLSEAFKKKLGVNARRCGMSPEKFIAKLLDDATDRKKLEKEGFFVDRAAKFAEGLGSRYGAIDWPTLLQNPEATDELVDGLMQIMCQLYGWKYWPIDAVRAWEKANPIDAIKAEQRGRAAALGVTAGI